MPIYEFYCSDCHTVFNFLARKTADRRRPDCPRCRRPKLERRASTFAVSSGRGEPSDEDLPESQRLFRDRDYTIRAWSAVITYLLADWRFLYHQ